LEKLVFLDEAGFNLAMTRFYARSLADERAFSVKPANRNGNISIVGSMRLSGLVALYPYDGSIDGYRFLDYLENQLLKSLKPGDVLIMDNLRVHHIKPVREMLKKAEIRLLFLPPYSPELNPIEEAWSKIKSIFRGIEARTISSFIDTLKDTYSAVTVENIAGWFQHAGYA
jgi:transposase